MATQTKKKPTFWENPGDYGIAIDVAASNTITVGQVVTNSVGTLIESIEDPANIAGIAETSGAGDSSESVHIKTVVKDTVLRINVYHATPGSAVTARSQLGSRFGGIVDPSDSDILMLDLADTGNAVFLIVGFVADYDNNEAIGDIYGNVLVKVLNAFRVF